MAKKREPKKPKPTQAEIRQSVTDTMVNAINEGTPPWRKPWSSSPNAGNPCNFDSGRRYTGINPLILWIASMENGYESRHWGTGKSWTEKTGGQIRKDESGTQIVYFNRFPAKDRETKEPVLDKDGKQVMVYSAGFWSIFNVDQIQAPAVETLLGGYSLVGNLLGDPKRKKGATTVAELLAIAARYMPKDKRPSSGSREEIALAVQAGIEENLKKYQVVLGEIRNRDPDFKPAEALIAATGADINYRGSKACYNGGTDKITMPPKGSFDNISHFYETAFHELNHWAENPKRVGKRERNIKDAEGRRKDEYAFGELVAEIGACFVCAELQIPLADQMIEDSRGYVKNWLERMGSDPKFIFDASSQASKTADYLLKFVGRENPEFEEKPVAKKATKKKRKVA